MYNLMMDNMSDIKLNNIKRGHPRKLHVIKTVIDDVQLIVGVTLTGHRGQLIDLIKCLGQRFTTRRECLSPTLLILYLHENVFCNGKT